MAPETADLSVLFSRKERRLEIDNHATADGTDSSHPGLTQRKGGPDTSVHQTGEPTAVTVRSTNTPELAGWEKRSAQWAKGTRGEMSGSESWKKCSARVCPRHPQSSVPVSICGGFSAGKASSVWRRICSGAWVVDSVDRVFPRLPSHALPSQKLSLALLPHPSCTRRPFRHSAFEPQWWFGRGNHRTLALAAALLVTWCHHPHPTHVPWCGRKSCGTRCKSQAGSVTDGPGRPLSHDSRFLPRVYQLPLGLTEEEGSEGTGTPVPSEPGCLSKWLSTP